MYNIEISCGTISKKPEKKQDMRGIPPKPSISREFRPRSLQQGYEVLLINIDANLSPVLYTQRARDGLALSC